MNINYKDELNQQQYNIVTTADGPCLVLAGAGSGKTRTLTYRVAYLLEKGVKPENILLMTFTNKAADEMITRVSELTGKNPKSLWAGTFHKIGNKMLRQFGHLLGFSPSFTILDHNESKDLYKSIYKELGLELKGKNFPKVDLTASMISYIRNTGLDIEDALYTHYHIPSFNIEKIVEIFDIYTDRKRELNAMDFDDLLVLWLELMKTNPGVREQIAQKFEYVLVDEYQDTNQIQSQIIYLVSAVHKNLLAVGDDSQSIYSFRAADVNNILDFEKHFDNAKVFKLEINYRSTPEILNLANASILNNQRQYKKQLKSVKDSLTKPVVIPAKNVHQQADFIIDRIKELQREGKTLKEIAVLFRAAHQSAELQLALSKHNIPFVMRSGRKYFDQAHIKDLISFIKVWAHHHDDLSWFRILKLLPGIGDKSAANIIAQIKMHPTLASAISQNFKLSAKQKSSFRMYRDIFMYLTDLEKNPAESEAKEGIIADGLRYIVNSYYRDYLKNSYEDYQNRLDDIQAFTDFAARYTDLAQFLTDITLDENFAGEQNKQDDEKLVLSSIHQAKGLEWDDVIIIGLREGNFPHFRSLESLAEIEEERRLFYVAVTRARKNLTMLYPILTFSYDTGEMRGGASMFIQELPDDTYVKLYSSYDEEPQELLKTRSKKPYWQPGDDFFSENSDDEVVDEFADMDDFFDEDVIEYD